MHLLCMLLSGLTQTHTDYIYIYIYEIEKKLIDVYFKILTIYFLIFTRNE